MANKIRAIIEEHETLQRAVDATNCPVAPNTILRALSGLRMRRSQRIAIATWLKMDAAVNQ